MKQQELTFSFHNPNSEAATAAFLIKVFAAANQSKVERLILKGSRGPLSSASEPQTAASAFLSSGSDTRVKSQDT